MSFLLYGSYGYTGQLILSLAHNAGHRLLLAGRREAPLQELAQTFGCPYEVVSLEETEKLDALLDKFPAVMHAAGPYSRTARPMAEACIRTGTHYLDVTGELEVFELLTRYDQKARAANVMLLPGAGFDVVPTDCLANHLAAQLPDATHLTLAFKGSGHLSRGTATTVVENLDKGGMVRRDGKLVAVPTAYKTRSLTFKGKSYQGMTIPWGDVSTAWHSTGIPNIEVYTVVAPSMIKWMKMSNYLGWLLGSEPVQSFLKNKIDQRPAGPSPGQREKGTSLVWGEAKNEAGQTVSGRISGPDGYTLTASAAWCLLQKVLDGNVKPGFQTPAKAYGADLIREIPGCEME
ncbi:MAG: saccharopine dehydrogenase NADP-binding domain-containing protein [Bacteroidota bacterium]